MRTPTLAGCAAIALAVAWTTAAAQVDIVERTRTIIGQLAKGEFAAVVATFDPKMRAALPEEKLRSTWMSVQSQVGAFQGLGEPRTATKGDFRIVVVPAQFENARAEIQVAFAPSGEVVGLNVRPAAAAAGASADAPYVVPARFTERAMTIDAGGWPLPAAVAMPEGKGPFRALVLVHGSGPGDRDQTLGPNKPFRDLALGLASRGIAVLRYDKRTRVHGTKLAGLTSFTVKDETVDDAVAAVRLLRATPGIDAAQVYVLGHSLGGMLVPRMAAAAGSDVAGWIVMAGAARPLEQALADQLRYLAQTDGVISSDEQKQLDEVEALAAKVKALRPGDPPLSALGISAPSSYWIDLRGYDPPTAARRVTARMLVLQGERDYQVTVDEFARWKAALGERKDVTLKSYPELNHLFIAGTGRSLPSEYAVAGHVAEEVIADIAGWIAK